MDDRNKIVRALYAGVDKALSIQRPMVVENLRRMRERAPDLTPAQAITSLEQTYRNSMTLMGGATGAAAALPVVTTGPVIVVALAESGAFLEASALFALSCAEVHGIKVVDPDARRTLFLGIMLGDTGSGLIERTAGRTGPYWARRIVSAVPVDVLRAINKVLGQNFVTKYGTKQGIIVLGEAVPFGIGAIIGGGGNRLLSGGVIRAGRKAFGPAPVDWPGSL